MSYSAFVNTHFIGIRIAYIFFKINNGISGLSVYTMIYWSLPSR